MVENAIQVESPTSALQKSNVCKVDRISVAILAPARSVDLSPSDR